MENSETLLQQMAETLLQLEKRMDALERAQEQRNEEQRRNKQYGLCTDQPRRIY